jgi:hypothetical protein
MSAALLFASQPESAVRTAPTVWSVFARSLAEQGVDGRTALAWRWALVGDCPSPVTLALPIHRAPSLQELMTEAEASPQPSSTAADPGGQVMHARFVLQWLAGGLDALPLWNGGPGGPYVTDGVESPRSAALMDDVHSWAMLADLRHPWLRDDSAEGRTSSGAARGVVELMDWVCGETLNGPLTGGGRRGSGDRLCIRWRLRSSLRWGDWWRRGIRATR